MCQWYYRDLQSRKIGPLSDQEFEERVAEGAIQPKTRVWRSGLADWTTYEALLAHEARCQAESAGPTVSVAPLSSSRSTFFVLGASAVHQRPRGSCIATPVATPRGLGTLAFDKCPVRRENVTAQLLRREDRLRDAKGVHSDWITKFLIRCALLAGLLVLGRVILIELSHKSESSSRRPTVEPPRASIAGAPSDIKVVPLAGR